METQNTLRETLQASFDNVEAGSVAPVQTPIVEAKSEPVAERARDEKGKFTEKKEESEVKIEPEVKAEVKLEPETETPQRKRPTTWKKEYMPIWDKIAQGQPLTPEESVKLADYTEQRETEYKTGVSTYKTEAMQAKALQDAMTPFLAEMPPKVTPAQFITNLGNAHLMLTKGTPEQKVQLFAHLANEYGVPLNMVAGYMGGQQPDQTSLQLMQEIQQLKQQVSGVASWRDSLEQQSVNEQLSEMQNPEKYPYFEMLKPNMIQFLENGQAQTLVEAYKKAAEPLENLLSERLTQTQTAQTQVSQQAVQKAKATAVSPKSATPSGAIASGAKDRRSALDAAFNQYAGGRV
jgi:hypothetical protein